MSSGVKQTERPQGCGVAACPLSTDARAVMDAGLPFWQCPRCGSLRIPDGEITAPEVEPDAPGETPLVMRLLMRYRLVWLRATVPALRSPGGRVLDVGAGDGQWQEFLIKAGYRQTVGVEVNPRRLAHARMRGLTVHPSLEDATGTGGRFDVIFLWQVVEHVPQSLALIEELLGALAPGGVLIVSVPNQDSTQIRWFGVRSSLIDYGRHIWYWRPDFFLRMPELIPGTLARRLPEWNYEYEIYSWADTLVSLLVRRHHFVHTRLKKGEGSQAEKAAAAVLSVLMLPLAVLLSIGTQVRSSRSSTLTYCLSRPGG